jgi:hypothetical protein
MQKQRLKEKVHCKTVWRIVEKTRKVYNIDRWREGLKTIRWVRKGWNKADLSTQTLKFLVSLNRRDLLNDVSHISEAFNDIIHVANTHDFRRK